MPCTLRDRWKRQILLRIHFLMIQAMSSYEIGWLIYVIIMLQPDDRISMYKTITVMDDKGSSRSFKLVTRKVNCNTLVLRARRFKRIKIRVAFKLRHHQKALDHVIGRFHVHLCWLNSKVCSNVLVCSQPS